jgi:hypothetical protein
MNYKQLDIVLHGIESYFTPASGKQSLLLYQVNPIKAAMQL